MRTPAAPISLFNHRTQIDRSVVFWVVHEFLELMLRFLHVRFPFVVVDEGVAVHAFEHQLPLLQQLIVADMIPQEDIDRLVLHFSRGFHKLLAAIAEYVEETESGT